MNILAHIEKIVSKINEYNLFLLAFLIMIPALPLVALYEGCRKIYRHFRPVKVIKTERELLLERIERKEVRLCDLPHEHHPQDPEFTFVHADIPRFPKNQLTYVASEDDSMVRTFLTKEKDWLDAWTEKYGFRIVLPSCQEDLLNELCFPQDRELLAHGLLRDKHMWSSDREYGVPVSLFRYYPLENLPVPEMKELLECIAQDIYDERY